MGREIECYIDIASFYSFIAFSDLKRNIKTLHQYGVDVKFNFVQLGQIYQTSGNSPPWLVPAKAQYQRYECARALARVGQTNAAVPADLMSRVQTEPVHCALLYIMANHSFKTFLSALESCYDRFWIPPHINFAIDESLEAALTEATVEAGTVKLFTGKEVKEIMEGRSTKEATLQKATERVLGLGAFGTPWFWGTDSKGESQPFFGSDRFNNIYDFLEIPYQGLKILPSM